MLMILNVESYIFNTISSTRGGVRVYSVFAINVETQVIITKQMHVNFAMTCCY